MESTPSFNTLLEEIESNLTTQFGISQDKMSPDAKLVEDLDLDSIDMVDLLSIASDKYDVSLSPLDFDGVETLEELVRKLESLLNTRADTTP